MERVRGSFLQCGGGHEKEAFIISFVVSDDR
jgi:hypothetical protein